MFSDADAPIDESDIRAVEAGLGFALPEPLRALYLKSNGGWPTNQHLERGRIDTVVSEFLPLISASGATTSVATYRSLVLDKRLVPRHLFPFAYDAGGNYLFVDCQSAEGDVYFYRHDTIAKNRLIPAGVGVAEFWASLTE